jgi:HlyD family secretion protein
VVVAAAAVVLGGGAAAGYVAWKQYQASALPAGIVSVNGRVEATQVDISTKIPGRVIEIIPHEGDIVPIGSVVASIDTSQTMAQLHQAQASAELARQTLITRQASVASDDAQLDFANEELRRTSTLIAKGWSTHETLDKRQQELKSADAALKAAQSQVDEARAFVKTADAKVEELQAVIDDSTIKAPVRGRVQYRLVEPGAVLPPGGKVATVIDLSTSTRRYSSRPVAGALKSAMTRAWRVDAAPNSSFPPRSRSWRPNRTTPKTVEVQSEREQLMFRVAAGAAPVAQEYRGSGQGGLRGMGYVKIDPAAEWPARLTVKLPPMDDQAGK